MRRAIAKRLDKRDRPHAVASTLAPADALLALRQRLRFPPGMSAGAGATPLSSVSVNDLVVKAAAAALRDCRNVNLVAGEAVKLDGPVDVAVAVATPAGLITPIVEGADKLSLTQINSKVRDLATRAKENKLKPHEFMGGTFTISNLGMFGIDEFSAVINPPQSCILAVGKTITKAVPPARRSPGEPLRPVVANFMSLRLSYDRRMLSEGEAATFMQVLTHYIGNPELLLL